MKHIYSFVLWFILFPSSLVLSGLLSFGYGDVMKVEQTLIYIFVTQFLIFIEFFIRGEK